MSTDTTTPTAALIVIGNEILSGRTRDANILTAARKLGAKGIALTEVRVVPDDEAAIIGAVDALRARVTHLFTTGGIGPTHDDITAACVARAFGVPLTENPDAVAILAERYGAAFTPERRRMCTMPAGARLIGNALTGAPGFRVENVHVLAGVPAIMEAMLDDALAQLPSAPALISATVQVARPESTIAMALGQLQDAHPEVEIGSYPHFDAATKRSAGVEIVIRAHDAGAVERVRAEVARAIAGAP